MNFSVMPVCQYPMAGLILIALFFSFVKSAHAGFPMYTDDASTLEKGKMKIGAGWQRYDKEAGSFLSYSLSPLENTEIGAARNWIRDTRGEHSTDLKGTGIGLKWVPLQVDEWSLGLRTDYTRTRISQRNESSYLHSNYDVIVLASYQWQDDRLLHLNLGVVKSHSQGQSDEVTVWAAGYEWPLTGRVALMVEMFGEDDLTPHKAAGVRYEITKDLQVGASVGGSRHHGFGQIGFEWSF